MNGIERAVERYLPEGLRNKLPLRAETLEEFIGFLKANGVSRVGAEVSSIYHRDSISPMLAPFLIPGNGDSTVYFGINEKGRKIVFREDYEDPKERWKFRTETDRQKTVIRALFTTDLRLAEIQEALPKIKVAIEGRGIDMDEKTLREISFSAMAHGLSPYPKKSDSRLEKLAEDWDRLQRSLR